MLLRFVFSVIPVRTLALAILVVVLIQLAGVDLAGMAMTELSNALDPTSWFDLNGLW